MSHDWFQNEIRSSIETFVRQFGTVSVPGPNCIQGSGSTADYDSFRAQFKNYVVPQDIEITESHDG
ncbi:hypothetical protein JCM11491_006190, partial [Sporobolomyces phaffii]